MVKLKTVSLLMVVGFDGYGMVGFCTYNKWGGGEGTGVRKHFLDGFACWWIEVAWVVSCPLFYGATLNPRGCSKKVWYTWLMNINDL